MPEEKPQTSFIKRDEQENPQYDEESENFDCFTPERLIGIQRITAQNSKIKVD